MIGSGPVAGSLGGVPRTLARALCDTRGATAVEFALVAPLFFAVVFSTFEAGWLMTQTLMQDSAVDKVVRQLRVKGNSAITADEVRHNICEAAVVLFNCEKNTMVELKPMPGKNVFPDDPANCVHRGSAPAYTPGIRSDYMFVRVCTTVTPLTPMLGLALDLPESDSGAFGIVTSAAFVNEPQ